MTFCELANFKHFEEFRKSNSITRMFLFIETFPKNILAIVSSSNMVLISQEVSPNDGVLLLHHYKLFGISFISLHLDKGKLSIPSCWYDLEIH